METIIDDIRNLAESLEDSSKDLVELIQKLETTIKEDSDIIFSLKVYLFYLNI